MSYHVIAGFKGKVASLKFTDRKGVPCSANRPVLVKVCLLVHLLVYLCYSFVSAVPTRHRGPRRIHNIWA